MASLGTIEAWPAFAIAFAFVVIWTTMAGVECLIVVRIARRAALNLARQLKRSASAGQAPGGPQQRLGLRVVPQSQLELEGLAAVKGAAGTTLAPTAAAAGIDAEPGELLDGDNPSGVHASQLPLNSEAADVAVAGTQQPEDADSAGAAAEFSASAGAGERSLHVSKGSDASAPLAGSHVAAARTVSAPSESPPLTSFKLPRLRMRGSDADAATSPDSDAAVACAADLPGAIEAGSADGPFAGAADGRDCAKQPQPEHHAGVPAQAGSFTTRLSTSRQISSRGTLADGSARQKMDAVPVALSTAAAVASADADAVDADGSMRQQTARQATSNRVEELTVRPASVLDRAPASDAAGDPAGLTPAHTAVAVSIAEPLPHGVIAAAFTAAASPDSLPVAAAGALEVARDAAGPDAAALAASASGVTVGLMLLEFEPAHHHHDGLHVGAAALSASAAHGHDGHDGLTAEAVVTVADHHGGDGLENHHDAEAAAASTRDASVPSVHAACNPGTGAVALVSAEGLVATTADGRSAVADRPASLVPAAAADRFGSPLRPLARSPVLMTALLWQAGIAAMVV